MKKLSIAFCNVLLFISLFTPAYAQEFPAKPATLVNDYTGTLTAQQKQSLENKLVQYNDSTSTQIAVAMVQTVGDYDIGEYALELGRKWGVGSEKNNGVMIVVAIGDRKLSIQTGYGVEGALPDVYTKRIREENINPHFKAGDYYGGLDEGTDAIIGYLKGEYKNSKPKQKNGGGIPGVAIILIIVVVIAILIKRGGGGGGSQVIGGRGVANALFWSMLLGGGGRGGSGFGGGGGSFGGGGGGGFGGFGGGSFGGGGSSGSW